MSLGKAGMNLRRRGMAVGLSAFGLAVLIFLGTLFQAGVMVDEALAQSSVRPPDNAVVNVRPPEPPASGAPKGQA